MCTFKEKITNKEVVTGYKVAIQDNCGHYYSPITGVRYEVGKVKSATKYGKHNMREMLNFRDVLDSKINCFKGGYFGKTAVFNLLSDAKSFKYLLEHRYFGSTYKRLNPFVILEMELTNDLYWGIYRLYGNVYIGSNIKSIKKVKIK